MLNRDRDIIADLKRFRVLTRAQIQALHFASLKDSVTGCNRVLKRMVRDGHISYSNQRRMYLYFPDKSIKKDSAKIDHFLAIADAYLEFCKVQKPTYFEVEPKLNAKGTIEPDALMVWRGAPVFLEIQRSRYTKKQMNEKFDLYQQYYDGGAWKELSYQPADRKIFPHVVMLTDHVYNVGDRPFRVFQVKDVNSLG